VRRRRGPEGVEIRRTAGWVVIVRRILLGLLLAVVGFYVIALTTLVYLRFFPPPITTVQIQRQVEAWIGGDDYRRQYHYRPASQISRHMPRAAVAAEDTRFYRHGGIDWEAIEQAREEARRRGTDPRGASTITQQLVKNLFLTTHRSVIRKGVELTLVYPTEWILGKDRILVLYVNVVEMGDGVFGVEAAARHHYGVSAADLSRHQAASLAAVLPAPRSRSPHRMGWYASIIQQRMAQMGW